jgi:Glycosyl transferase family 2
MPGFINLAPRRFTVHQFLKILLISLFFLLFLFFGSKHKLGQSSHKIVHQTRFHQPLKVSEDKLPIQTVKPRTTTRKNVTHKTNKTSSKILAPSTRKIVNHKTKKTSAKISPPSTLHANKTSILYGAFKSPPNIFNRTDLGEMGVGVKMPEVIPSNIRKVYDEGWKKNQFNQYLSDLISLHRKLPDYRTDWCKKAEKGYSKKLPATSVIIIFHNEAWTTLLRSVHSVIDRSPDHLIKEIILVDDFSSMSKFEVLLIFTIELF